MKRLAAFLLALPVYANEPPFLPIASCVDGVCTMKQEDYEKFQRFHEAVFEASSIQEKQLELAIQENATLRKQLARNAYCQLRKI